MCPNQFIPKEKKGYMDFGLYKQIIEQIAPHTSSVYLLVGGESLLHPKLPEMVAYARRYGIRVLLNTNATILTPMLSKRLIDAGLSHITFALDGYTKDVYESIRVGADWTPRYGTSKRSYHTARKAH